MGRVAELGTQLEFPTRVAGTGVLESSQVRVSGSRNYNNAISYALSDINQTSYKKYKINRGIDTHMYTYIYLE